MVQPVSREEELQRSSSSVFAERQEELEAMADKMPKRVAGQFPYLMEKNTGVIHPYTEAMAERSDLVIGCYNLDGSRNPDDADQYYNPQALAMRGERVRRVESVGPRNAAEAKAAAAEETGRIRREERERADAELEERLVAERERIRQELLAEMQPTDPTTAEPQTTEKKSTAKKGSAKKGAAVKKEDVVPAEPATPAEPVAPAEEVADTQAAGAGSEPDLNAAFQAAME